MRIDVRLTFAAAEDYAPFNAVWNKPDGGLHAYLVRFLSSADITFQHIAVWVSRASVHFTVKQ